MPAPAPSVGNAGAQTDPSTTAPATTAPGATTAPTDPSVNPVPAPAPGERPAGKPGRGGHGPRGEALTGDTADKVTAAAQAAVPDGTVDRVESAPDATTYEAHVTKADGSRVVVKIDSTFAVTSIDAAPTPPAGGGGRHGGGCDPATMPNVPADQEVPATPATPPTTASPST